MEDKDPAAGQEKVIVLHGFTPEEAGLVMRAVKGGVECASDAAFAMTTDTSLGWKVSYLVEHVAEEHREFRALRAAQSKKK
jgi:hypothetical protein